MNADVQYRKLRNSEAEEASELCRKVYDEFLGAEQSAKGREEVRRRTSAAALRQRQDPGGATFVAERQGRIVGVIQLQNGSHIAMLFVDGRCQRQGIGSGLVLAVEHYVRSQQPSVRTLTVGSTPSAVPAYQKMGFVPTGTEEVLNGFRFVPMERTVGMPARSRRSIPPLQRPDILHLHAAQGWVELGNHQEADTELDEITAEMRAHPDVLEVRWHIYAKVEKWDACVDISEAIIKLDPNRDLAWVHRSFALHELNRTEEAYDRLLPVADRFLTIWTIPYNLACYCAQLGRLDECKQWFKKAMALDERTVKRHAIDDPDLEPLWDSMGGTAWKRVD